MSCNATDDSGNVGSCGFEVTVQDTIAPIPDQNDLATVTGECSAEITSSPTASDTCVGTIQGTTSDALRYEEQGTHTVTWTFDDGHGNTTTQTQFIIVEDMTPPSIESVIANPSVLSPPNHKMVPVTLSVTALDACNVSPSCQVINVTSNEQPNKKGDGNTVPDWQIIGDLLVDLRAERSGNGNGREYTITVECIDNTGNTATDTVVVSVAHDQSNGKTPQKKGKK